MLCDTLVRASGDPVDWEADPMSANVSSIGLVKSDRVVDPAKLEALGGVDSQRLLDILRTGGNRVFVVLRRADGSVVKSVGSAPTGRISAVSKRVVSYMGDLAVLEVTLWTPR